MDWEGMGETYRSGSTTNANTFYASRATFYVRVCRSINIRRCRTRFTQGTILVWHSSGVCDLFERVCQRWSGAGSTVSSYIPCGWDWWMVDTSEETGAYLLYSDEWWLYLIVINLQCPVCKADVTQPSTPGPIEPSETTPLLPPRSPWPQILYPVSYYSITTHSWE